MCSIVALFDASTGMWLSIIANRLVAVSWRLDAHFVQLLRQVMQTGVRVDVLLELQSILDDVIFNRVLHGFFAKSCVDFAC